MKDVQEFAKQYQKEMGWSIEAGNYEENRASLLNNYMLLTTEVAEVAEELRKAFNLTYKHVQNGLEEEAAFELASEAVKEDVGKELADCLAYIMKFANFFDINREESFYRKMEEVKNRQNKDAIAKK
ncbi:MazG nucleotide pyrophosphohydrolase domain-containing protein [Planococcus shenhongbingii]|uniref:MazG nucleotide pyrophosphohydrolase domain-containing protein n=1 Tax=Planococcus shenhongbingii TaxID=3058398 RepID=UPI00260ED818|nr:MazG nucleotide pyrophosphohydrolase domain-containing protein [Planococcus sp. N016]WKA58510.1 MazG nucleotide pyrophosphohydrolase domain-containing protein [Planococcus sp. N016]